MVENCRAATVGTLDTASPEGALAKDIVILGRYLSRSQAFVVSNMDEADRSCKDLAEQLPKAPVQWQCLGFLRYRHSMPV